MWVYVSQDTSVSSSRLKNKRDKTGKLLAVFARCLLEILPLAYRIQLK
jgi:hypothetical protein